jgi:hypothetical protein
MRVVAPSAIRKLSEEEFSFEAAAHQTVAAHRPYFCCLRRAVPQSGGRQF